MSKHPKHHYIPVFYLQQWADTCGRLIEYSRQGPHNFVKARPTSPTGTGYARGLNLVPGASPDVVEFVEKEFMRLVDEWAARALVAFLSPDKEPSIRERIGWARFIYSLILRTPEHIELIRKKSAEFNIASPPQALLPRLINSTTAIQNISKMAWHVADFSTSASRFLTSDRPLIMTNGLAQDDSHLALPISPTRIFLEVQKHTMLESLKTLDAQLVSIANTRIAEQAIKYVYGTDASQLYFIAKHLGKRIRATPLDEVVAG
jgi:hypothetical protein